MIVSNSPRIVRMIVAKVTNDQKLAGWFSRNSNSIPVDRPVDRAKRGLGRVRFLSPTLIKGINGANFLQ